MAEDATPTEPTVEQTASTAREAAAQLFEARQERERGEPSPGDSSTHEDDPPPADDDPPAVEEQDDLDLGEAEDDPPAEQAAADDGGEPELEDDPERLQNLTELAESLEVELEDLYDLEFITQVNGEAKAAKLRDAINGYTGSANLTRQSEELADSRREFETEKQTFADERQKTMESANRLVRVTAAYMLGEFATRTDEDWAKLKTDDPEKWERDASTYKARLADVESLQKEYDNQNGALLEKAQKDFNAYKETERQKFISEHKPEWANPEAYAKGWAERVTMLKDVGFTDEEIEFLADGRYLRIVEWAMIGKKIEKANPIVKKKVKTAPRTVRRQTSRQPASQAAIDSAEQAFQDNPNPRTAAAAMAAKRDAGKPTQRARR